MNKRHALLLEIVYEHLDTLENSKEEIVSDIIKLNTELKSNAPQFRQAVNKLLFESATIGAAIYISIKERVETGSLVIVENIFKDFFRRCVEGSRITIFIFSIFHKIPFIGKVLCFLLTRANEENGWIAKKGPRGAFISVDITKCGIYTFFEKLGIQELCKVFCILDDINAEYMKGVEFKREGTIANGNESCKFRYYKRVTP